jgi:hypothetical protein
MKERKMHGQIGFSTVDAWLFAIASSAALILAAVGSRWVAGRTSSAKRSINNISDDP